MRDIRRLSHVKRWAIVPKIKDQSVAEHSYFVSLYTLKMCQELGKSTEFSLNAVEYALQHDAGEAFTGDIPSPLKDIVGGIKEAENTIKEWMGLNLSITDEMSSIVHLADKLDALLWLIQEYRMGNTTIVRIKHELLVRVNERSRELGLGAFVSRLVEEASNPAGLYAK